MAEQSTQRRRPGCLEWGCVVALSLFVVIVVLLPFFVRSTDDHPRVESCPSHEKQLLIGMLMYGQDWDERLPRVQTWAPALKPYLSHQTDALLRLGRCPQDERPAVARGDGVPSPLSYAMVPRWSLHRLLNSGEAPSMVLLYDVGPMGPAYRHSDGLNVGFGDGHAKWLPRDAFSPLTVQGGLYRVPAGPPPIPKTGAAKAVPSERQQKESAVNNVRPDLPPR